jgi:hypothetical protein
LKRLAAVLDETQGSIVRKALALYEARVNAQGNERKLPRKTTEELERASSAIRKKDAKWAVISDIVEQTTIPIEEFYPAMWGHET